MENLESGTSPLVSELAQALELVTELGAHLAQPSFSMEFCKSLAVKLLCSTEKSIGMVKACGAGRKRPADAGPSPSVESSPPLSCTPSLLSDASDQPFKCLDRIGSPKKRKTLPRWKRQVGVSSVGGVEGLLEDGHSWRKYGQKDILGAKYPSLWQDAQTRVYLIKELDRRTGQGKSAISVYDTLKVVACRHQHKRLAALEMELAAARHDGFVGKYSSEHNGTHSGKRLLAVIGIITSFGRKNYRDAVRKSWLPSSSTLKKLEEERGILIRFIIGRSANRGDSFDRGIDDENKHTKDFMILDKHVEAPEERPKKTKFFFAQAADTFDAEFYAKVNDDIYVNIDILGAMLATHLDKPRAYIGCMKSGEVFSDSTHKWYEPDWWKFGDGKSYFRHASGEMLVISRALAQFISINRFTLRTYAHDDVSIGSWMIGLDVKHVDEGKLCCSSWSPGSICTAL